MAKTSEFCMEEKKIIRLYHAGNLVIENPDVHYSRKNADFGQGFYNRMMKNFPADGQGKEKDRRHMSMSMILTARI